MLRTPTKELENIINLSFLFMDKFILVISRSNEESYGVKAEEHSGGWVRMRGIWVEGRGRVHLRVSNNGEVRI